MLKITSVAASELNAHIEKMNADTRDWTDRAARGECGWICADCCCTFPKGMPDECCVGHAFCNQLIQRDKLRAMRDGNEPS